MKKCNIRMKLSIETNKLEYGEEFIQFYRRNAHYCNQINCLWNRFEIWCSDLQNYQQLKLKQVDRKNHQQWVKSSYGLNCIIDSKLFSIHDTRHEITIQMNCRNLSAFVLFAFLLKNGIIIYLELSILFLSLFKQKKNAN